MAKVLRNPKPGVLCYEPYRPSLAGKVIKVVSQQHGPMCTIKWIDGTESEQLAMYLNDFTALVEETRKKLRTHEAMLAQLAKL